MGRYAPARTAVEDVWANMKNGLGNLAAGNPDYLATVVTNKLPV